jgi:hypothetical protein
VNYLLKQQSTQLPAMKAVISHEISSTVVDKEAEVCLANCFFFIFLILYISLADQHTLFAV